MEATAVQSCVEAALTQTLQIRELYSSNLGTTWKDVNFETSQVLLGRRIQ